MAVSTNGSSQRCPCLILRIALPNVVIRERPFWESAVLRTTISTDKFLGRMFPKLHYSVLNVDYNKVMLC